MLPRKVDLVGEARARIDKVFDPHIVADVNDAQVKIAKFGEAFEWHAHDDEDEAFLVLEGRIAIDFEDGVVELGPGEFLAIPAKTRHRPRSLTSEPIVLMFEPATTLNTGDAQSDKTVRELKRL